MWLVSAKPNNKKKRARDVALSPNPSLTVNFLNIRTPKKFVVITLKFELCGSIIE